MLIIYKSFLRPHFDYGDVIYDRAFNESFQNKLESVQYKAALVITGTIWGSSREKLCQELGLDIKITAIEPKIELLFQTKKKINIPFTFLIWFPKSYQHGLPEIITTSLHLMLNINTSETISLHPLLSSGTSSTILFQIRNRLVLLKNKFLNSSEQALIVRLMCIIRMELNYLQDYELG